MHWRMWFAWFLSFSWMGLIFSLSHQPGSASSELSQGLLIYLLEGFQKVLPNVSTDSQLLHLFLRKGAHFFAYMVLGILLMNAFRTMKLFQIRHAFIAFGIAVLYACSDEFHQTFIPGRSGQISDVILDALGAATGIIGYTLLFHWFSKYFKRRNI